MILFPINEGQREDIINLWDMAHSSNKDDLILADSIMSNFDIHKVHISMYIDIQTVKMLEFCTPYYEYVGVRTLTPISYYSSGWGLSFSVYGQPFGIKMKNDWNNNKIESSGDCGTWPAIWRAVEHAGFNKNCGNSHQSQINDQGTTGLYQNINKKWFKHIHI